MTKAELIENLKKPYGENLLTTPRKFLKSIDGQRQFLLKLALMTSPCAWPDCKKPVSQVDAADPATWTLEKGDVDSAFTCPHCKRGLQRVIPLVAMPQPWFWMPR